jgi:uncharacterized protein YkwD
MYVRATISLLIVVALVAGTAGCATFAWDLTVASAGGGSVLTPGNGTSFYAEGDVVDLIAVPDPGYRFVSWTGHVGTVADVNAAETIVIMNGRYTIIANFEEIPPDRYSLTVASTAGGSVTTPGEGTFAYDPGTAISLVAKPSGGYGFISWSGDVSAVADVNSASTTVTVNGDYVISANFGEVPPRRYDLTVSSTTGGSVTAPGEGTFIYDEGEVVNLTGVAEEGYRFVRWNGDTTAVGNTESTSTAVTMYGNYSVTASFEPVPVVRHDLTVASTGGGWVITPGTGTFAYDQGTVVSLAASPASGYRFVNWTGHVAMVANVNAASTAIAMHGSYSIRANFEPITSVWYYLAITSTAGGSVTAPGEGNYVCSAGMVVALVATPAAGYQFVNWTGNVGTVADVNAASTTITMNGSYSIRANFEQISSGQFGLTASSTTGGSVTSPGEGTFSYDAGTVVGLTATPASGYYFVNWTGDVGTIGNVNAASTTITMQGSYSIRANFEQISSGRFGLTASSTTGGSVTSPGEGTFTYDAGTVVSLTATPAGGYQFVNWTGDVGTIGNVNAASTTITMNGSYSIRANFSAESSSPPGIGYTTAEAEALIIVLVNNERQSFGLSAISEDALLTSLAREHSVSMVENGFFGHERYPRERPFNYGQQPGTIRGENLAMIPTRRTIPGPYLSLHEVCEWAVSAWMGSPGHRANILEPRYNKTGVGVAFSQDGNYLYITQMFEGPY